MVKRKNGWQLAEHLGDTRPWRTQRVLSHVLWDEEAARDLCRDYAIERLGAEDAVLVVDETGFLKKGKHSAGVDLAPGSGGFANEPQYPRRAG
jgi:SRSO17 transposase